MSKRLHRIIEDHRSLIICRFIRSLRSSENSRYSAISFSYIHQRCAEFVGAFESLVSSLDSSPLEALFKSLNKNDMHRGLCINDAMQIVSVFRDVCFSLIEKRFRHNSQAEARIKLALESYLRTVMSLYASAYSTVLISTVRKSHQVYERIFMETRDCVFSVDPELKIKIVNPAMERFIGMPLSQLKGRKCYEVLTWKHGQRRCRCGAGCAVMDAFRGGERAAYYEGILALGKGRYRWVGTTASCVSGRGGEIEEIIMTMRDITASRERQQRLEEEIKTFETLAETTRGIELKIPCMSEFVVTARAQAELIARRMNFRPERIQDIKSAVGEACDNAIEHGCSHQGVDIRYRVKGSNLVIEVEDYGQGFELESVSSELPSPFTEGGRGLYLIRNLVDEAEIITSRGCGTKVLMEIYRKPELYRKWKHERDWRSRDEACII